MSSALSISLDRMLPPLDVHAHVDPTVTAAQLGTLGSALVFAVTRSLAEAERVRSRNDDRLIWGLGTHPGVSDAIAQYDGATFRRLLPDFMLVGEIGLDRRVSGEGAVAVLHDTLAAARDQKRISTVHSTGRHTAVVEAVADSGACVILHWFLGSSTHIERATEAGAFFSVNAAMSDSQITSLPTDRLLPETDFPFTKKAGSRLPGDIEVLERRVAQLLGLSRDSVRQMWYLNLRNALKAAGCLDSVPNALMKPLLSA